MRALRGMSRRELARRSGLSERFVAQIEAGKGNVSIVRLLRISLVFRGDSRFVRRVDSERSAPRALLHIGNSFRHTKCLAADFGEHGDALADLLVQGAGKAQA